MGPLKVILNPIAGRGYGAKIESDLCRFLEAEGLRALSACRVLHGVCRLTCPHCFLPAAAFEAIMGGARQGTLRKLHGL